ncbi:hypothetical protein F0M16_11000 [Vibrio cholerae]|uniref:Uncharacterized protein n=1 Tax=Vibrio cholerae TaxID=666 RepID=A0A5Q6PIZ7_VIBCL|nr:hypothetical protein F0M16_11000 [Vibrio cholerae]
MLEKTPDAHSHKSTLGSFHRDYHK